ncbi:MAG: HyaD/HybD family hydrogenase maturation endopeptidase [Sulfurospirillum sp.]|nr:HyaD/HybD family hydrogenase maturation endopeptidase [Sulfurospirillum sp.]
MKILVLGIGNVMFSDEGVGVHLCRLMEEKYKFTSGTHTLDFIDGGTLAHALIPIIAQYEYCIIFDTVDVDNANIGDVYFFDFEQIPAGVKFQGSVHEVEMLHTLSMMDLVGDRPPTKIIGIVPEVIAETTLQMTQAIIKSSALMEQTFLSHMKELGFTCELQKEIGIQEVANKSCQQER